MDSISLEMESSSLIAVKSFAKPVWVGVAPLVEVIAVAMEVVVVMGGGGGVWAIGGVETALVGVTDRWIWGCFFRSDGGTMLGASSFGGSFPLTFSAMRNIANANCSALSFPLLSMSHSVL